MDIDKIEDNLLKTQQQLKAKTKKLVKFNLKLGVGIVIYIFLMWVFISIYHTFGFEYAVIALGVSMISAGLKNMAGL